FAKLGYWQWNASSDSLILSERAAKIFGIEVNQRVTWSTVRDLLADPRSEALKIVQHATTDLSHYEVEFQIRRPVDGELVWVSARGHAPGAHDKTACMIGIVEDITARKNREHANDDERRSLEILNRTGAFIGAELDLEKLVQAVTDAAVELTHAK